MQQDCNPPAAARDSVGKAAAPIVGPMNEHFRDTPTGLPGGPGNDGTAPDRGLPEVEPEAGPIGSRLGHDPGRLGEEVADAGDLVYPTPEADTPKSM